jgi:hypothetical protein
MSRFTQSFSHRGLGVFLHRPLKPTISTHDSLVSNYYLLQQTIIRAQVQDSILKKAIGRDWQGKLSPVLYIVALVATLRST